MSTHKLSYDSKAGRQAKSGLTPLCQVLERGMKFTYYGRRSIAFENTDHAERATKAVMLGGALRAEIRHGRYEGSVVEIDAKYLVVLSNGRSVAFNADSFLAKLEDGRKVRIPTDTYVAQYIKGRLPTTPLRLKEVIPPPKPESFKDRHGIELKKGDNVLISMVRGFAFGAVENITAKHITIKRGKVRTRVDNDKVALQGVVKLDKDLVGRFLIEKLSKA